MTFNRAQKTAPRVLRLSGERDLTSVADLFSFSGRTPPWKSDSRGFIDESESRSDWHKTLGQIREVMSKAEKLDPSSRVAEETGRAAEEFVHRFRKAEGNLPVTLGSSLNCSEKVQRQRRENNLDGALQLQPQDGTEPKKFSPGRGGSYGAFRRSQSHGTVGRLLAGPETSALRRLDAAPERGSGGGKSVQDAQDPVPRLTRSQTDTMEGQPALSRVASLPRLPRRNTTGF